MHSTTDYRYNPALFCTCEESFMPFSPISSGRLLSHSLLAFIALIMMNACSNQPVEHINLVGERAPSMLANSDKDFMQPYIDVDEWRDEPVRHRYIHGGFTGTQTRFSYYFPPAKQYDGRFFQHITPFPLSENLGSKLPAGRFNKIGFSIDSGAYFVETNGGSNAHLADMGIGGGDPTITAYRANAATAQYSRAVAKKIYSTNDRPFGYAYGGSGGGFRTIGSMENTEGVWDGAVPYVIGSTMAIPNMFTIRMHAMRILQDKFPQIIDAVDAGGSGNPYESLSKIEADAYREITRMGFPPEAWFGYKTMGIHGFAALYGGVRMADPGYFAGFWNTPGYLGYDRPDMFEGHRLQFRTSITALITAGEAAAANISTDTTKTDDRGGVDTAFKMTEEEASQIVGFKLASTPPRVHFLGGDLLVQSGASQGKELTIAHIKGDIIILGINNPQLVNTLQVGDKVQVDNSNFLAAQTYHRHQVPSPDFSAWDQFRDDEGKPIYPQRPFLIGPMFVQSTSGSQMTGKVDEKMIIVASLLDREAMPWQADWYLKRVQAYHGDKADDQIRLYYTDRALHGDEPENQDSTRVVSYVGMLQQALRDVAAWAEDGIAPPSSTGYDIIDAQVIISNDAAERKGIQPVVNITTGNSERIEVKVGEEIEFTGTISAPPGVGGVISAEWDFEGAGTFAVKSRVKAGEPETTVSASHRFDKPGTYFVVLRGASQRDGDAKTPYAVLENIDRLRVIVR